MSEVTHTVTLDQLNAQRKENQQSVDIAEAAHRLASNSDFRKVILQGFCVEDCARYAQLSQDPNLTAEQQKDSLLLAQAAGHLRRYLSVKVQMGMQAANAIKAIDEAILEDSQEG